MKKLLAFLLCCLLLCGCTSGGGQDAEIAATTLPVYEFTAALCQGTGLTVARLINDSVSCLHDYSLSVSQVRTAENAKTLVISGAGLEDFLDGVADTSRAIDASAGIPLLCSDHHHEEAEDHGHHHEEDPHIWLSPVHAKTMAGNICDGLCQTYPQHADTFRQNLLALNEKLDVLYAYGQEQLSALSCREIITFHDGFAYLAQCFGLTILAAVEEESGSEASANMLKDLIGMVEEHHLPAVFTEHSGSTGAASAICAETGAAQFSLDMAMSGNSYWDALYHNIDTLKEALS